MLFDPSHIKGGGGEGGPQKKFGGQILNFAAKFFLEA